MRKNGVAIKRFEKNERRTVTIDWLMVKQIIFGHQIAPWVLSRIVQFATLFSNGESTSMPLLFSSVPSHSEWKFVKKQEHFKMCDKCNGDGYVNSETVTPE
jgi:hypothetical protein